MRHPRARRAIVATGVVALVSAMAVLGRLGPLEAQPPTPASQSPDGGVPPTEVEVEEVAHVEIESLDHGEVQEVTVGIYVHNIEAIDLQSNSYSMNLELWMRWRGPIDPTESFRLANVLDESSLTVRRVRSAPTEIDGQHYRRFHIEGRFFHKFWLGTFPLDWQHVTFEIYDTQYPTSVLSYVADHRDSAVDPIVRLPGWRIVEQELITDDLDRASNFGMGSASPGNSFPRYEFSVTIERPVSFYLFKIFPPIAITLACCLLVFLLRPTYVDARVGTPIAGLLTAVFLQLTFTGGLPNLGIMLLIDHVFNLTYAVIFMVALSCILTSKSVDEIEQLRDVRNHADDASERRRLGARIELLENRMHKVNGRTMLALPIAYLVGVAAITFAVRGPYVLEMLAR